MGMVETNERSKEVIEYYTTCEICDKEIRGRTVAHMRSNLKIHLSLKHDSDGKTVEEDRE